MSSNCILPPPDSFTYLLHEQIQSFSEYRYSEKGEEQNRMLGAFKRPTHETDQAERQGSGRHTKHIDAKWWTTQADIQPRNGTMDHTPTIYVYPRRDRRLTRTSQPARALSAGLLPIHVPCPPHSAVRRQLHPKACPPRYRKTCEQWNSIHRVLRVRDRQANNLPLRHNPRRRHQHL